METKEVIGPEIWKPHPCDSIDKNVARLESELEYQRALSIVMDHDYIEPPAAKGLYLNIGDPDKLSPDLRNEVERLRIRLRDHLYRTGQ